MKVIGYLLASFRAILIVLSLVFYLVLFVVMTLLFIKKTQSRAFRIRRSWVKLTNFILGIHVQRKGAPPEGVSLFISNHRSFSDPLVLCKFLDVFVIAKAEVANIPLIHTGAKLTGILYVQRDDKNSRSAVRKAMVETLLNGYNVLVYPEGTTNKDLQTMDYKAGTFREAANQNIQVVPIVLEYKRQKDLWYQSSLLKQFFRQFSAWKTEAQLSFGPALKSSDGEYLRLKAQTWANEEIVNIHNSWDSYFNSQIRMQEQTSVI